MKFNSCPQNVAKQVMRWTYCILLAGARTAFRQHQECRHGMLLPSGSFKPQASMWVIANTSQVGRGPVKLSSFIECDQVRFKEVVERRLWRHEHHGWTALSVWSEIPAGIPPDQMTLLSCDHHELLLLAGCEWSGEIRACGGHAEPQSGGCDEPEARYSLSSAACCTISCSLRLNTASVLTLFLSYLQSWHPSNQSRFSVHSCPVDTADSV